MSRLTPALNSRGRFVVAAPFNVDIKTGTIYTCIALRKFEDLVELGENLYKKYYQAYGLTEDIFQRDSQQKTVIVSLIDNNGSVFYVPDSYVLSYPNQGDTAYNHLVLSCSLGPLPSYIDVAFLEQQVAAIVSDLIGVEPRMNLDHVDMINSVTPQQHEVLEAARLSRIETRLTDRARLLTANNQITLLQEQVTVMQQYLVDNGLLT